MTSGNLEFSRSSWGSARIYHGSQDGYCNFNPRTPHGVRRPRWPTPWRCSRFQPTHPSRGATHECIRMVLADAISTHTPLTGCDHRLMPMRRIFLQFQPAHPSRGATCPPPILAIPESISIHAPLTGCDCVGLDGLYCTVEFQSTHPSRGATGCHSHGNLRHRFQSTHPSRGATTVKQIAHTRDWISIHAPLTGCDGKNCRFEQQFLRLGSREAGSVRPSANQTRTAQKIHFSCPLGGARRPGISGPLPLRMLQTL